MNIGIVGLGLIGGSLAKSAKKNTKYKVYGYDISKDVIKNAIAEKSIDGELTEKRLASCDYVFIPLYPEAVIEYVEKNAKIFKDGATVIDCAGVKRSVCEKCFEIAIIMIQG